MATNRFHVRLLGPVNGAHPARSDALDDLELTGNLLAEVGVCHGVRLPSFAAKPTSELVRQRGRMDVPPPHVSSASSSPAAPPGAAPRGAGPPTPPFREALASLRGSSPPHPSLRTSLGGRSSSRPTRPERAAPRPAVRMGSIRPPRRPSFLSLPCSDPRSARRGRPRWARRATGPPWRPSRPLGALHGPRQGGARRPRGEAPPPRAPGRGPPRGVPEARGSSAVGGAPSRKGNAVRAEDLAERLRSELGRRGLALEAIDVRIG